MKKVALNVVLGAVLSAPVFVSSPVMAEDGHRATVAAVGHVEASAPVTQSLNWGYVGAGAPHRWGELSSMYEVCAIGKRQSPVNVDTIVEAVLPPLGGSYHDVPLEVANSGHTVQVNYAAGSGFKAASKDYNLVKLSFHTPSEHYVDGAPYPMEVQLEHKAADGSFAVVAVMIKVGKHNPVVEGIWQNVPVAGAVKAVDGVSINAASLLPADKGYYKYDGSLTTPPCTEGVAWHVMKQPIEISAEQLKAFLAVFPVNARPIQPLGERVITGN